MLLWVIFALMTSAVLIAVLAPLARPAAPADDADAGALEVYRDQLAEVEVERARGLVEAAEADAARIEISRRLLASAAPSASGATSAAAGPQIICRSPSRPPCSSRSRASPSI
jgi:cytochrome c-type biogenesis protein CcmH